jgi:hypothetical protein
MWGNRFKAIGWAFTGFVGYQVGDYCVDEGKKYLAHQFNMGDSNPFIEKQIPEQDAGRSKDKFRRRP